MSLSFRSYEEFWVYCSCQCPCFKVGCACSCELRKKLEIPPFSNSYLDKLKGEVK